MNIQAFVRIRAWDKAGILFHDKEEESHSFVRAFLQIVLEQISEASIAAVIDTGGTSRTVGTSGLLAANGAVNTSTKGIRIGTGSTAVDIADNKLVTEIVTGLGSGQMVHQAQSNPTAVTTADPDVTFVINRNFNNNSGASITVSETAIYCITSSFTFCIVRDVPTAVIVPDGGGCNVAYTLKITE